MKQKAHVNVYLILLKGDQILLSLRRNTGYEDGKWSLVAGHGEGGEAATAALIREAYEEIGIEIEVANLSVVHIMHRKTDRENLDIFMSVKHWDKEIVNKEPEKCGDIRFFNLNGLSSTTTNYIVKAIEHIKNNQFYSELGWL